MSENSVSIEQLKERLVFLRESKQNCLDTMNANLNAHEGGIQECEHWIEELSKAEEQPEPVEEPEPVDNVVQLDAKPAEQRP